MRFRKGNKFGYSGFIPGFAQSSYWRSQSHSVRGLSLSSVRVTRMTIPLESHRREGVRRCTTQAMAGRKWLLPKQWLSPIRLVHPLGAENPHCGLRGKAGLSRSRGLSRAEEDCRYQGHPREVAGNPPGCTGHHIPTQPAQPAERLSPHRLATADTFEQLSAFRLMLEA